MSTESGAGRRGAGDRARPAAGAAAGGGQAEILDQLRQVLAAVTGRAELRSVAADTALFGAGVGLDSLAGTLLLREVQRRFGVDVAAEDINLDALATLGTLAAFVRARLPHPPPGPG